MLPVTEAAAKIPWVASCEVAARVARHLGYPTENARLRIVRYVRARRITCGRTAEGWLVSLFPVVWREGADLDAANLELSLDELIAADLLPAPGGSEGPAERARQPADRAIAYLITGYLVEWADWTPEMIREMERGEIKLGEAICDGLSAWGQKSLQAPLEQIPRNDFRSEMVAMKALPVNPLRMPKVVVRVDGTVGVSPRHRLPDYIGPPWCLIEVEWAGLKSPTPRSPIAEPEVNRGGRPTDRDLLLEEAARRLRHKSPPPTLRAFARQLHSWLEEHGEHRAKKTSEVMKVQTIEGHVRRLWKRRGSDR